MSERSEDALTLNDFYAYLARWSDSYPGGIPRETLEEEAPPVEPSLKTEGKKGNSYFGGGSIKAVFLADELESGVTERSLFQAAVEKGLAWQIEEALLIAFPKEEILSLTAYELFSLSGASDGEATLVILGSHLFPENSEVLEASSQYFSSVLVTEGLQEVIKDKASKRRFWEDLQRIK